MASALNKLFIPLFSLPGLYELPPECLVPNFVPADHLAPTFGGIVQLLFLFGTYGLFLFIGSTLISDGSELLFLIPEYANLVGSVVLPILGAVPDGAIILFSGLSGTAQQAQVSLKVGIGALAGSTVMLLTIPWMLSVVAGRVKIVGGNADYHKPKLRGNENLLSGTGVQPKYSSMMRGAVWMAITVIPYIIIQGSGFSYQNESFRQAASHESYFSLVSMCLCIVFFIAYLITEIREAKHNRIIKEKIHQTRTKALKDGVLSLEALFKGTEIQNSERGSFTLLGQTPHSELKKIVDIFFKKYDLDGNGNIDNHELKALLSDLHLPSDIKSVKQWVKRMDANNDGTIDCKEFFSAIKEMITGQSRLSSNNTVVSYGSISNGSPKKTCFNTILSRYRWSTRETQTT